VRSTRHITKAMEMVAAAKLRRAQLSALAARPFAESMEAVLQRLTFAARSLAHPLFERRPLEQLLLVVVASDKGLCGAFNSNVFKRASRRIGEVSAPRARVAPVGRRPHRFYLRAGWTPAAGLDTIGDLVDRTRAERLAAQVTQLFITRAVDRVEFVYTRFESVARRTVVVSPLLPVEPVEGEDSSGAYIFEPNPDAVLAELLPRYVTTRVYSMLADSLASEHAARMVAMGNATRNADDVIRRLTLHGNKLRQAAITKELLEVVGGAEALG
jgi:F-type H+-transporting ATPase subunit gamma